MRTTVKTWLKNQEKVKLEVQDKSDGQGEPVVQPAADDPAVKGDLQTDVTVNPEDVTDTQPPEIQETPVAEVLPSIEVGFFQDRVGSWSLTVYIRSPTTKYSITTTTSSFRLNLTTSTSNYPYNDRRVWKKPLNPYLPNPSSTSRSRRTYTVITATTG